MTKEKPVADEPLPEDRPQLPDEAIPARLIRGRVVVTGEPAKVLYEAGYYGSLSASDKLTLEPEEALLLLRRQRIAVEDSKKTQLEFSDLLERLAEKRSGLWIRFLVYSDLRSRGYVVRTGYGKGLLFRVYPRGAKLNEATAKYFVCAISEGSPLKVSELDVFSKQAKRNRKKLMLAVLDRQGEPTYYLVAPADIVAGK
jgi:tRNA-intron endonuclease